MQLGAFSISLAVQDLAASRAFYAKLGFEEIGGDAAQNWLILQSGDTVLGLFQGMFEKNVLTFNPGWNQRQETLAEFDDVRALQAELESRGLELVKRAAEGGTDPDSITLVDPDGNPVLIDQHVPAPAGRG